MIETLATIAIVLAIVYAFARTLGQMVLGPIHAKLDRLLELQEQQERTHPRQSVDSSAGDVAPVDR